MKASGNFSVLLFQLRTLVPFPLFSRLEGNDLWFQQSVGMRRGRWFSIRMSSWQHSCLRRVCKDLSSCCLQRHPCSKSLWLCPTLSDPMDCSPPGSSAHGILQSRILEWVVISFSRGSSPPRDRTQVSHVYPHWQVGSLPLAPPGKPRDTDQLKSAVADYARFSLIILVITLATFPFFEPWKKANIFKAASTVNRR